MKTRLCLVALLLFSLIAWGADSAPLFSALLAGQPVPKEFRIINLPRVAKNSFALVADAGKTVLRIDSDDSAGSIEIPIGLEAAGDGSGGRSSILEWRWKVSRIIEKADMDDKAGDDHPARVFVFFDVPLDTLPFVERNKIRLARLVSGLNVPTAALCYVWDNKHRVGYTAWSPYTRRERKIVLQSGPASAGQWMSEARDVAADFRQAFGIEAPAVIGLAIGSDTDNTNERVSTWFGDISFRK